MYTSCTNYGNGQVRILQYNTSTANVPWIFCSSLIARISNTVITTFSLLVLHLVCLLLGKNIVDITYLEKQTNSGSTSLQFRKLLFYYHKRIYRVVELLFCICTLIFYLKPKFFDILVTHFGRGPGPHHFLHLDEVVLSPIPM